MERKYFLAANWKMNGSLEFNKNLVLGLKERITENFYNNIDIVISPPNIYLPQVKNLLGNNTKLIILGSQNVSSYPNGAYTGETSLEMLQDFDVNSIIIGHSERRQYFNENNLEIAKKVAFVLNNSEQINPILCVGETLSERESGKTEQVIEEQLTVVLNFLRQQNILSDNNIMQRLVIAYEPIWAIGTGRVASADQANKVNRFIRGLIEKISLELSNKVRIIYGGSVKSNNASELISQPDIDGFLVGGASLDATEFYKILTHMCD